MPYSDFPPDVIYPDTEEGRWLAACERARYGQRTGECNQYEPLNECGENKWVPPMKNPCRNRQYWGEKSHNWCMRCMVGYPWWAGQPDTLENSGVKA